MKNDDEIIKAKKVLVEKYHINTDRDLIKQLGIKNFEDRRKLFAWIRYQNAFSYRDGFNNDQDELKNDLATLLRPNKEY